MGLIKRNTTQQRSYRETRDARDSNAKMFAIFLSARFGSEFRETGQT